MDQDTNQFYILSVFTIFESGWNWNKVMKENKLFGDNSIEYVAKLLGFAVSYKLKIKKFEEKLFYKPIICWIADI